MFKITSEDINKVMEQVNCTNDNKLNLEQIEIILKEFTRNQLDWNKVRQFGNGKIIDEQINNKDNANLIESSVMVDSMLFFEFILVIRQISRLISMLKSQFTSCKIEMENIGQFLRFNIQADNVSCATLFNILESNKDNLMIN
jgi:hypothetical protein